MLEQQAKSVEVWQNKLRESNASVKNLKQENERLKNQLETYLTKTQELKDVGLSSDFREILEKKRLELDAERTRNLQEIERRDQIYEA